jgi:hypothetical protein
MNKEYSADRYNRNGVIVDPRPLDREGFVW